MVTSPGQARKFHTLDAMRGVAALGVVTLHSPDYFNGYISSSHLAVDFFFLLSGFVLAHAYDARLRAPRAVGWFMGVRLIRLYPLYLLGLLLGLIALGLHFIRGDSPISAAAVGPAIGAGLFMLPTPPVYGIGDPFPINGPSWSLFLELLVNLIFALVVSRLTNRVLIIIVAAAGIALIATGLHFQTLHVGWLWATIWAGLPRVFFSFFLGVLMYRNRHSWTVITKFAWIWPLILALILLCRPQEPIRPWFELAAVLIVFPALLFIASAHEPGAYGAKVW